MKPRDVSAKAERFLMAWRTLLQGKPFSNGRRIEDFEAVADESRRIRAELQRLEAARRGLIAKRNAADRATAKMHQALVSTVRVQEDEPGMAGFLKAIGYIPRDDWRTGRTRRKPRATPPA